MFFERLLFHQHLEEDEQIFLVVHKHWIEILKPTLEVGFFGLLLPWGLYFIGFNAALFLWIVIAWSALAYCRYFYVLMDWYSDAWLITSNNIISVEWNGFFRNSAERVDYEDFEGVAYQIDGFWATVLGYGSLTLKVISGNSLSIHRAANPKRMELDIMRHQDKILEAKNFRTSEGIKEILAGMVAHHMREKLK